MMNSLWLFIDEIVGKGLPTSAIIKLLFYYSSTLIPLGLPLATLLAAIMTMGNMGENYELTALKAAGVSLLRILRSIIVLAVLIAVASFFVINNYVPYSFMKMGEILGDIRSQRQEIEFNDGVFFNGIPDVSIRVGKQDPQTSKLTDVLIFDNRDRSIAKTIIADSGYIAISPDKEYMNIRLFQGQNIEDNRNYYWLTKPTLRINDFSYQLMTLKLEGFNFEEGENSIYEGRSETKNINELQYDIDSLARISDSTISAYSSNFIRDMIFVKDSTLYRSVINDSIQTLLDSRTRFELKNQTIDTLTLKQRKDIYDDAVNKLQSMIYNTTSDHAKIAASTIILYRSKAGWHKKLSLPFSVIIFFLIGAPLGAIIRRGGLGLPVVVSVLFFVIYYILILMGERMVEEGAWPPILGMWLSSFVLGPIAIFLTLKARKDSQLFNIEMYYNFFKRIRAKFRKTK